MPKSFTDYRGYGFWANDAILEAWLAALADIVPSDAPPWLGEAQRAWYELAGVGFMGCVDASLDGMLTSPGRVQVILELATSAMEHVRGLADGTGYLPAQWLNERHISGELSWTSGNIRLDYVEQVAGAFTSLLRGELQTTPATSPVLPRPSP